jgi:glycosyltransferase involved in cell wall biosynthesis
MERPWLSVIMATYNGAAYLGSAMESLVAQREQGFEVVVVDDGSTDATLRILRAYCDRLPITLVERPHTGNWVANTNLGMSLAKGRYVCWLHQDDTWCRDRAAKLKHLAAQWPDALLQVHPSWFINAAGRRLGLWRCPFPRKMRYLPPTDVVGHLLVQDSIACVAPVFKAEAILHVGGLDEQLWYSADWDFWLKLAKLGRTVYYPPPLSSFRLHRESQTMTRAYAGSDLKSQFACVLARHLGDWTRFRPRTQSIDQIARFSARLNLALLDFTAGRSVDWLDLLSSFVRLRPAGWHIFLRDSRIVERCTSRLLARLRIRSSPQRNA